MYCDVFHEHVSVEFKNDESSEGDPAKTQYTSIIDAWLITHQFNREITLPDSGRSNFSLFLNQAIEFACLLHRYPCIDTIWISVMQN